MPELNNAVAQVMATERLLLKQKENLSVQKIEIDSKIKAAAVLRTAGHAGIYRISILAGWEHANCSCMGATLIAQRLRARFSRDTTAGRSIQRVPMTQRTSKDSPIQSTLCF